MIDTCRWTKVAAPCSTLGIAGCTQQYWYFNETYNFCPFCGKPIEGAWRVVVTNTVSTAAGDAKP